MLNNFQNVWAGGSSKNVSSSLLRTIPLQPPLTLGWLKSSFLLVSNMDKHYRVRILVALIQNGLIAG